MWKKWLHHLLITQDLTYPCIELHFTPKKKVGNLEYLGFQKSSDFWERIMADKLDPKGKWICFGHEMQRILFGTEAFHEVVPCGGVKTHVCCRETCYTYNNNMISLAFPILWALELCLIPTNIYVQNLALLETIVLGVGKEPNFTPSSISHWGLGAFLFTKFCSNCSMCSTHAPHSFKIHLQSFFQRFLGTMYHS
jgi:hypothetical protein